MPKVIGLGAGGHAKVVVEILRDAGLYEIVGLLDPKTNLHGTQIFGTEVLGDDQLLPELLASGTTNAFIGLGSAGNLAPRRRLYIATRLLGFDVISAIHRSVVISNSA